MRARRSLSYRLVVDAWAFGEMLALAGLTYAICAGDGLAGKTFDRRGAFGLVVLLANAGLAALKRGFETTLALERPPSARAAAAGWLVTVLPVAIAFSMDRPVSTDQVRLVGLTLALGIILVVASRRLCMVTLALLSRRGAFDRRVVLYGGGPAAAAIVERLSASTAARIEILGVFDDRGGDRRPAPIVNIPDRGTSADLLAFVRQTPVDVVIITLSIGAEARIRELIDKLWVLPVDIRLAMERSPLQFHPKTYSFLGGSPFLDLCDRPIAGLQGLAKAVLDRLLGTIGLVAALPLMACIALAIRATSPGPILFRQKRHGFNNEVIEIFKFRSMYVETLDAKGARTVLRDDPRVTPLGRVLRKTSLDELPQLFNVVFKGNLSLVGPRPHVPSGKVADVPYDDIIGHYCARHRVRPGITGWAQINGWRGSTLTPDQIERRVEFDLYYIDRWSMWFDLYILLLTPYAVIGGKEAY